MKQFFKMTLATICGIAIFLVVTGFFLTVSLLGMVASDSASTKVQENSVFVIKLDGTINERAEKDSPVNQILNMGDMSEMGLDDLICAIRKAKDNEDIKGIYLEGGALAFDAPATAQQLRDALKEFKKSGKWIVAYADSYFQTSYYVASVADNIYLNDHGTIDFEGLGGKGEYMKGLYDKLGIKYMVAKVGKYKSYVERNTQTGMSEYDREQRSAYQNGIWNYWLKEMAESRKVKAEALNQLANDSIMAFADTKDYVKARLVDKVMFPEEIKAEIKKRLKLGKDDDINQLTLSEMLNVKSKKNDEGEKIAIYYAYGSIVDSEAMNMMDGGEHCIVGKTTAEDLRKLADDDDVKAVVFRVNSGGGSAVASEQIRHAIKLLKAKKPVVVSMGGMAASGGYWISSPANYIFAEPTTITGSIGIFGTFPDISNLMTQKLGFKYDEVKTNRNANISFMATAHPFTGEELNLLQGYIDRGYALFRKRVADGRHLKVEDVEKIAQGHVWLGKDAIGIKLVDQLGSLKDAIDMAAKFAKIEDDDYYKASYPAKDDWTENLLQKATDGGNYLDAQFREVLGEYYEPFMLMKTIRQQSPVQARMMESFKVN